MPNAVNKHDLLEQHTPEIPEAMYRYGTDDVALKLRIKRGKRFTVHCFIKDVGMTEITNEGITDDIKMIVGNNKKVLKQGTKIFLTEEDFRKLGFDLKEANLREVIIPQFEEAEVENTGVRIKKASGEISRDATKVLAEKTKV